MDMLGAARTGGAHHIAMKTLPPAKIKVPFLWPLIVSLFIWLAVAFILTSCQSVPRVTIHGAYGDYSYSANDGIGITPHILRDK
jgi:hypothetical protein